MVAAESPAIEKRSGCLGRTLRNGVRVLGAVVLAGAAYLAALQLTGNFHEVARGELFRSAQPSASRLAEYRERYGIRTVVNLRGENAGKGWYDEEVAASRALGIAHVDFAMSAGTELPRETVDTITRILESAQKPILIHCQSGADRSGLVAGIYLANIKGVDVEVAEEQLTFWYGHVAIPGFSFSYAMDDTWERIEEWLGHDESARATTEP